VKRPLILVVEDEPSVMAFMRAALERSGYEVEAAETGARALELLRLHTYSGVISDMRTPGGVDGADVWEWISVHRPEMLAKLIFTTGDIVNDETAATLRRTGAPYVEKPFRVAQLIEALEKVLGETK
jgi:two-component system OmpR family response regulator